MPNRSYKTSGRRCKKHDSSVEALYLDHSATSPLREEVLDAMLPYMKGHFGNPSSTHSAGTRARRAVEEARDQVAQLVGASAEEIVFTSGGTESNNHVLRGCFPEACFGSRRLVVSTIEHPSVLSTAEDLRESRGVDTRKVSVDENGILRLDMLEDLISPQTALASIMQANNETGTLQPIADIVSICREKGIPLHVDAVQAAGTIPLNVSEPPVDFLTLSAHKLGGPMGIGACFIRKGCQLAHLITGGGQQAGRRSGTENLPAIVGFGKACEMIARSLDTESARLAALRDDLERFLLAEFCGASTNGSINTRAPHILSVCFPGWNAESLVAAWDKIGICASAGSACSAGSVKASHVLLAMGRSPASARASVRFSLGHSTTAEEIEEVTKRLRIWHEDVSDRALAL